MIVNVENETLLYLAIDERYSMSEDSNNTFGSNEQSHRGDK